VAELALKRGTGARGLRAVLEESMMDLMYEIPSRLEVVGCTITPTSSTANPNDPDLPRRSPPQRGLTPERHSE